jgi:hypothetical protein
MDTSWFLAIKWKKIDTLIAWLLQQVDTRWVSENLKKIDTLCVHEKTKNSNNWSSGIVEIQA